MRRRKSRVRRRGRFYKKILSNANGTFETVRGERGLIEHIGPHTIVYEEAVDKYIPKRQLVKRAR